MKIRFLSVFILIGPIICAQDVPDIKFGKISVEDLSKKAYSIDTGAAAVVLAHVGSTQIKGNDKGSVSLEFKQLKRVHILKSGGFDEATFEIRLYKQGEREEQIKDLKAVTYNLENGKVVESKLSVKNAVFDERIDRNSRIRKFALPNVKEGSIIEIEYKLVSDFLFNLQPWEFQSHIPVLWSQYMVSLPQFLNYVLIEQGGLPYHIRDQKDKQGNFLVEIPKEIYGGQMSSDRIDITCAVTDFRWIQKDVPAFVNDRFISSPANYLSRLEFQLAGYLPPFTEQKIMTTWQSMTRDLLGRADFGGQLQTNTYWMPELQQKILKPTGTKMETARRIYEYVRNNFSCTGYNQLFSDNVLDKVIDRKKGGVAELNLLLTCLLRAAGFTADPVILSTRGHGHVNNEYPVFSPFNYVICQVNIDGKAWLLDASRPKLGFGKLPEECFNGIARVVNNEATAINLSPSNNLEKNQTMVFVYNEPGGKWTASVKKLNGYNESFNLRNKLSSEGMSKIQQLLVANIIADAKIDSIRLDSVNVLESNVNAEFLLYGAYAAEDIIYLSPVMVSNFKNNPFKAANRKYPIEMPYRENEFYTATIQVPSGYLLDELPKSLVLKLNSKNDIVFEYNVSKSEAAVTINYKFELNRTEFAPEEYELIRNFFATMIAKLEEPVVCKRK